MFSRKNWKQHKNRRRMGNLWLFARFEGVYNQPRATNPGVEEAILPKKDDPHRDRSVLGVQFLHPSAVEARPFLLLPKPDCPRGSWPLLEGRRGAFHLKLLESPSP